MKFDTALANRVLDLIEADQKHWNQSFWRNECGTAYCFAGWVAALEGEFLVPDALVRQMPGQHIWAVASLRDHVLDPTSVQTLGTVLRDSVEASTYPGLVGGYMEEVLDLLMTTGRWPDREALLAQRIQHVGTWAALRLGLGDAHSAGQAEMLFESRLDLDEIKQMVGDFADKAAAEEATA